MGFLHKLWDETVAGPAPDCGLGRLRKLGSSPPTRRSPLSSPAGIAVTRSITIITSKNSSLLRSIAESPTEMPSMDFNKSVGSEESSAQSRERAEPRNPTVYDWIVISALDR